MVCTVLRDLVRALEGRQHVYRDHWGSKLANFRSIIFPSLADDPCYLTKVFDKSCAHAQKVQNSGWCL